MFWYINPDKDLIQRTLPLRRRLTNFVIHNIYPHQYMVFSYLWKDFVQFLFWLALTRIQKSAIFLRSATRSIPWKGIGSKSCHPESTSWGSFHTSSEWLSPFRRAFFRWQGNPPPLSQVSDVLRGFPLSLERSLRARFASSCGNDDPHWGVAYPWFGSDLLVVITSGEGLEEPSLWIRDTLPLFQKFQQVTKLGLVFIFGVKPRGRSWFP